MEFVKYSQGWSSGLRLHFSRFLWVILFCDIDLCQGQRVAGPQLVYLLFLLFMTRLTQKAEENTQWAAQYIEQEQFNMCVCISEDQTS